MRKLFFLFVVVVVVVVKHTRDNKIKGNGVRGWGWKMGLENVKLMKKLKAEEKNDEIKRSSFDNVKKKKKKEERKGFQLEAEKF